MLVVRRVDRHRRDRRGRIAQHRRPGRRVAGFRRGAGLLWAGVHRGGRGGRAAVAERHGSPAVPRSRCWRPPSRCAPSVMPAPARCRGSRRWGGHCRSGRTRAIAGGCCCCTWRRRLVLTLVAYRLLAGRDVGAGLIAERAGPAPAAAALRNVFGLTWRLDRGALLLWTVGLCLYGVLMGSVVHGIGDELGDSAVARDIVARMGGTSALEQAFIAVAFSHAGHGGRGVRRLAHLAAAPGRVRPASRDRRWPVRSPEHVGWQAIWCRRWPDRRWPCWSPGWRPG